MDVFLDSYLTNSAFCPLATNYSSLSTSYKQLIETNSQITNQTANSWSLTGSDEALKIIQAHQASFEVETDFLRLTWDTLVYIFVRLKFMFYLVWPSDTMFSSLEEVPRYVSEMYAVWVAVAIFETIVRFIQGKNACRINETLGSISQGIFQECFRIKVRSIEVLVYCIVWNNWRLVSLPWNSFWTWWICYLGVDFGFYLAHRIAHEVNFIWAIHQAHHSSTEFSILSALRQAFLQPFTAWITYVPLALFVPPQVFLAHLQLSELYMSWLHTEIIDTIGPLEYILNTPSHHRVHHSRNPEYIDKNYGGMLIIWDRLFNTFKAEDKNNPPVYGLVHPVRSFNPIKIQFHPWPVIWRRMKRYSNWSHKLGVLFKGPGWRPGLSRLGNHDELPPIVRPVDVYDPKVGLMMNAYVVLHFLVLIILYHELTLAHDQYSPLIVNIGVFALLGSLTSLGILLDNKHSYSTAFELLRCLMFFQLKQFLLPILDSGLRRSGLSFSYRAIVVNSIYMYFLISVLINSLILPLKIVKGKNQSIFFFLQINSHRRPSSLDALKCFVNC